MRRAEAACVGVCRPGESGSLAARQPLQVLPPRRGSSPPAHLAVCRDGHRARAAARRGGRRGPHLGAAPAPHAHQAVAPGALEGGRRGQGQVGQVLAGYRGCCGRHSFLLPRPTRTPAPHAPQSVLAVVLGSDRQWVGSVAGVAGVVVLRTLLQARAQGRGWTRCRQCVWLLVAGMPEGPVPAGGRLGWSPPDGTLGPRLQPLTRSAPPRPRPAPTHPPTHPSTGPHRQPERQERGPGAAPGPAWLCQVGGWVRGRAAAGPGWRRGGPRTGGPQRALVRPAAGQAAGPLTAPLHFTRPAG